MTPAAGTANVTVTKTITGLSAADADTLAKKLSFKVGDVRTLKYSDMTWTFENGVAGYGFLALAVIGIY